MKIGIVGSCGIVGSALTFGFKKLGHKVLEHDIKLNTKIETLKNTEIIYVCVPTPSLDDGTCDISIVENIAKQLKQINYKGIVALKSTVTPGITDLLYSRYILDICHVPEFLRERSAITDFVELNRVLVIGVSEDRQDIANKIIESHGKYPWAVKIVSPIESETIKLVHNAINALRIVFANEIYSICNQNLSNYDNIKECILLSTEMPDKYLDVNKDVRGYSSICLNKDIPSLIQYAKSLGLKLPLLSAIPIANNRFKKTPFTGTRENY